MNLESFIRESNRIEAISRSPTGVEIQAHKRFFDLDRLTVEDVSRFVSDVSGASLRNKPGMDVIVGGHVPLKGGEEVEVRLNNLLTNINSGDLGSYEAHLAYEDLHPYMDGNGRSGRAIWAWQIGPNVAFHLGFLHRFYYQTLSRMRT